MSGELMPRQTIESIVNLRNRAMESFAYAHAAELASEEAITTAWRHAREAAAFIVNENVDKEKRNTATKASAISPLDEYLEGKRQVLDADIWANLTRLLHLEDIMDAEAKKKFDEEMKTTPPEVTEGNIRATLETLLTQRGEMFSRGVAKVFSQLDRRFRSHTAWKVENRIIFNGAFDESGHWNYYRRREYELMDVERVFYVLDGKKAPGRNGGIVGAYDEAKKGNYGPAQRVIETEYFRLRTYKNGNAHLWFLRKDLVEQLNKIIADYYGEVIPDDCTEADTSGLNDPKRTPAKNFGFFPSPPGVVEFVMGHLSDRYRTTDSMRALEPSAGTGNLANAMRSKGWQVHCVEVQHHLAEALKHGGFQTVHHRDFLDMSPETIGLFDRIAMNPPFDRGRDIDHVMHAVKFLKPGGLLVSVMHAGTEFSQTKKAIAFREFVKSKGGRWHDLPEGSFKAVGTNVNTIVVSIWNDGTPSRW